MSNDITKDQLKKGMQIPGMSKNVSPEAEKQAIEELSQPGEQDRIRDKSSKGQIIRPMDQLKEALMYFGPQLAASILEGPEAGEIAGKAMEGFRTHLREQEKLALQREALEAQKGRAGSRAKYQQMLGLRDDKGRPLTFDPNTGKPLDVDGQEYTGKFVDPTTGRMQVRSEKRDVRDSKSTIKTSIKAFNKLVNESHVTLKTVNASLILLGKEGAEQNKLAPGVVARSLARLAGEVGRLTEEDVKAFEGNKAIDARLRRVFTRATTGKMTKEDVEIMKDALSKLSEAEKKYIDQSAQRIAGQYGNIHQNLSPNKIYKTLIPLLDRDKEEKPQQQGSIESRSSKLLDRIKKIKGQE